MSPGRHPLVEQVLAGADPELARLAASGLLPLPPDELIPVQVLLARGGEPELAALADTTLRALSVPQTVDFVQHTAGPDEMAYFALAGAHPAIVEAVVRRRDVPRTLLAEVARRASAELQEILLLRQDAIIEAPEILDALEANPQLSSYGKRRVREYREHLLPREGASRRWEDREGEATEEEVKAALSAAVKAPAKGDVDEQTGLSEGQIRMLPVPVRLRLSRGAGRTLRGILIRDAHPQVALSVLRGSMMPDQEIEQIAASRNVITDVLEEIARRREWMAKYGVISALVHNPKTPVGISVRLLPRMSVRDLRNLGRDRNVPDAVRSTALRLYRIKHV